MDAAGSAKFDLFIYWSYLFGVYIHMYQGVYFKTINSSLHLQGTNTALFVAVPMALGQTGTGESKCGIDVAGIEGGSGWGVEQRAVMSVAFGCRILISIW